MQTVLPREGRGHEMRPVQLLAASQTAATEGEMSRRSPQMGGL